MTYYENIESFYEAHKDSLINGDFRPVVSYNKDAEEYINKLVKIYESSGCPNEITLKQLEKGLEVTEGSNVASTESPLTWSSLGLIVGSGDGVNKKNANYKYIFTDEFIELAAGIYRTVVQNETGIQSRCHARGRFRKNAKRQARAQHRGAGQEACGRRGVYHLACAP